MNGSLCGRMAFGAALRSEVGQERAAGTSTYSTEHLFDLWIYSLVESAGLDQFPIGPSEHHGHGPN